MDKIYSRRRIRLPKTITYYSGSNKKPVLKIIIVILISVITAYSIIQAIGPIFEGLAVQKAKAIATEVMNKKISEVLAKHDYKDLVWIMKDENTANNILRTDVVTINRIASEIAIEVENNLLNVQNSKIEIAIGALTGSKYLTGSGPKIPLKIIPSGNVTTELKTEFESKGINQTIYRIYLQLDCDMKILTPYENLEHKIENQVLLVETVIVGEIPQTYYNLEGLTQDDTMDFIAN